MVTVLRTCSSVSVPRREQVVLCDFALNQHLSYAIVGLFFPFVLLVCISFLLSLFFSPLLFLVGFSLPAIFLTRFSPLDCAGGWR